MILREHTQIEKKAVKKKYFKKYFKEMEVTMMTHWIRSRYLVTAKQMPRFLVREYLKMLKT